MISIMLISMALAMTPDRYGNADSDNNLAIDNPVFTLSDVADFAKSPTQDTFAIMTTDRNIYLWDDESQEVGISFEGAGGIIKGNPTWSPDGQLLTATCENGACLWDAKTGTLLRILSGHPVHIVSEIFSLKDYVRVADSLAFSPDGQVLATANRYDEAVILWNTETGVMIRTLYTNAMEDGVYDIQFSSNGAIFAMGRSFSASLWTTDSWELIRTINGSNETMALSPDGELFAIGFGRLVSGIEVWNVRIREQLNVFQAPLHVENLQWLSANKTLIGNFTSGLLISDGFAYTGSAIHAWDMLSTEERHTFQITSTGKVAYEFAPGETLIGIGIGNAADLILLWNSDTDKVYNTNVFTAENETEVQITSAETHAYELSPDEKSIAAGTDNGLAVIWDIRTGERLKTLQLDNAPIHKITWLSDGKSLVTLSDNRMTQWNIA